MALHRTQRTVLIQFNQKRLKEYYSIQSDWKTVNSIEINKINNKRASSTLAVIKTTTIFEHQIEEVEKTEPMEVCHH